MEVHTIHMTEPRGLNGCHGDHLRLYMGSLTWKLAGSPIMSLLITLRLGYKERREEGRGGGGESPKHLYSCWGSYLTTMETMFYHALHAYDMVSIVTWHKLEYTWGDVLVIQPSALGNTPLTPSLTCMYTYVRYQFCYMCNMTTIRTTVRSEWSSTIALVRNVLWIEAWKNEILLTWCFD